MELELYNNISNTAASIKRNYTAAIQSIMHFYDEANELLHNNGNINAVTFSKYAICLHYFTTFGVMIY